MKRYITYFLLIALTLQSFYRSLAAVEYQIHLPDYIAKCINKSNPELHCDGQCILMEKIREKEKEESKQHLVVYEYSSLYVHNETSLFHLQVTSENPIDTPLSWYVADYQFNYFTTLFRPPIA